jgi:hypothetical protein
MEVPVGSDLEPDVIAVDGTQEMMPLQDLVEQNSIKEAAEGEAEHIARPWTVASGCGDCHDAPWVGEPFHPLNRQC